MNGGASRWVVGSIVVLAAATVSAQPFSVPVGKWWERPRIAARLGITQDQVGRLNAATYPHAKAMIDLKASVEKATIDLQAASEAEPFEAERARIAFAALQQARQRLETERFEMLLKVRAILTAEQWTRLQDLVRERREEAAEGGQATPGPGLRRNQPPRRWQN
ncbi:MAG TPA: periplasmic heavy metal sensor [Thermoanaerobaculaceae bacterium]|nr:periplasmic heavy metal sensor [Thermoanaerobaculaceae bacterium]